MPISNPEVEAAFYKEPMQTVMSVASTRSNTCESEKCIVVWVINENRFQ